MKISGEETDRKQRHSLRRLEKPRLPRLHPIAKMDPIDRESRDSLGKDVITL
jgi:hypothetical protein